MASRLLEWIREKTAKAKVPTVDEDNVDTTLPGELTPSSSSSSSSSASSSRGSILISAPDATANSPFFQELPFEIRHSILTHAFAGNTLHIMIKPMAYRPPGSTSPQRVRPVKERLWYTVCPALDSVRTSRDRLRPYGEWCKCWSEGFRSRCIGIMGWLMSCRQAYAESIDILYGQNTMHMRRDIIECLPKMILPRRLRSITSVELRDVTCNFRISRKSISEIHESVSLYGHLKDLLATLPHLRKLYLSIEGLVLRGFRVENESVAAILEQSLMIPMNDMLLSSNTTLRECSMTVHVSCMRQPYTVYVRALEYLYFQGHWIRHGKQNINLDDRIMGGTSRESPTLRDLESSSYTLEAVPVFAT